MSWVIPHRLHRREHDCQVFAGNRVHIGERALAPNPRPRRHRAVISCLSSNLRVSFVTFVLSLSIAVARECGHHDARLSGVLGAVKPLRFAPSLAGWRA